MVVKKIDEEYVTLVTITGMFKETQTLDELLPAVQQTAAMQAQAHSGSCAFLRVPMVVISTLHSFDPLKDLSRLMK